MDYEVRTRTSTALPGDNHANTTYAVFAFPESKKGREEKMVRLTPHSVPYLTLQGYIHLHHLVPSQQTERWVAFAFQLRRVWVHSHFRATNPCISAPYIQYSFPHPSPYVRKCQTTIVRT